MVDRSPSSKTQGRSEASDCWSSIFLVLAVVLSFLSLLVFTRVDSWDELYTAGAINFLVIGPLWAAAVGLHFRGRLRIILGLLALLLPAAGLTLWQLTVTHVRFTPSRVALTHNAMRFTLVRIQTYMKKHRCPPPDLSVVPVEDGPLGRPVDGWGNDLLYSVDRDGVITLTSLGADGEPGGESHDADIVMRYRTRNRDGRLNVDRHDWIDAAEIKDGRSG